MWHVLVTPTLLIPLNHWMQSHSNTELFLNWLNTFPSTLIISTIPILNMHLLVLITLYKCVHAYLENIQTKCIRMCFLGQSNQFWIAQPTVLHTAHFCPRHSKSAQNIMHQWPRQLVLPSNKVFLQLGTLWQKCACRASHNVPTHCAQHNGTQPSHIHERVFYPISIFTKELSF